MQLPAGRAVAIGGGRNVMTVAGLPASIVAAPAEPLWRVVVKRLEIREASDASVRH